jgi:ATP-dependent helicase/nuclease subunit A
MPKTKTETRAGKGKGLPDAEARRAIAEDLGTTILVEAAAGTGKTRSLLDRMVALVATGTARVENLSAVTFTIRAAAQLSQGFQNELEKRREAEADEVRRGRLDAALQALDSSFLGTIHAFCARLLRERPVEAGVDPDFREMDEPEDNVSREEAWERYVQSLFVADAPVIPRLAALGIRLADLRDAYEGICENSDVQPSIGPETPEPDFSEARRRVAAFLEKAAPAIPAEAGRDGWTPFEQAIRRALRLAALLDLERGPDFVQLLQTLRSSRAREKAPRALKTALATLQEEVVKPALVRWAEHVYPVVMPVLVGARDAYRAWRRENGRLNFQDLLLEARDLLRARSDVRLALRRRFTPILVDEFQDTDPIQAEILFYLTGEDTAEQDWKKLRPAPGSLFVVGDPKQSIYRFRRADIETYQTVRRLVEESGGRVLRLSTNFRSAAPLCEWINRVFGRPEFFPTAPTTEQAAYVPLAPHRLESEKGPSVLRLDVPGSGNRVEPVIRDDARSIGRFLSSEIGRGRRKPGDFLILFRRRRYMSAYARVLEQQGIPYEIAGGGAFGESEELAALMPILDAVADPDDPVPFLAALRGPVFGVDDDALYRFAQSGGRFRFQADVAPNADARIERAAAILREGLVFAETLPPAAAIARLCERLGLIALAAAEELGESRAGNLLKALAAARKFSAEGRDFRGVVREISRMRGEDLIEQMSVEPGRPGVVRLMTLHGSKGLEAPVVLLAEPAADNRHGRNYWIDREREPPLGHFRIAQKVGQRGDVDIALPPGWERMCRTEERFEEAERVRLLYVGATRAKDLLVVSVKRTAAGKAAGPWAALDPYLAADLSLPGPPPAPATAPAPGLSETLDAARTRRAGARAIAGAATYRVSAVTDIAHAAGRKPAWEATGRGMSWGRVLHRALEAAMRDPKLDLRLHAANLLAAEERPEGEVEEVVRLVEAVRGSPLWSRALAARRCLVEVPFALNVPSPELGIEEAPPESLLQGAVDLAFEETDGWVLVDYKSDAVGGNRDDLVRFYTPQVVLYRRYWERLTGRPARAGLFFLETRETVWIEPG